MKIYKQILLFFSSLVAVGFISSAVDARPPKNVSAEQEVNQAVKGILLDLDAHQWDLETLNKHATPHLRTWLDAKGYSTELVNKLGPLQKFNGFKGEYQYDGSLLSKELIAASGVANVEFKKAPAKIGMLLVKRKQHWYVDTYGIRVNLTELMEKKLAEDAEKGSPTASYQLATILHEKKNDPDSVKRAVKLIRFAAEHGDAGAQYDYAFWLKQGEGVKKNSAEAARWFEAAAKQNQKWAANSLAVMYEKGDGVKRDYAKALQLYKQAAKQGDGFSMYNIGLKYRTGVGTRIDGKKAEHWYQQAKKKHIACASLDLGILYAKGIGVRQSDTKARQAFIDSIIDAANKDQEFDIMMPFDYRSSKGVNTLSRRFADYMIAHERKQPLTKAHKTDELLMKSLLVQFDKRCWR